MKSWANAEVVVVVIVVVVEVAVRVQVPNIVSVVSRPKRDTRKQHNELWFTE